MGCKTGQDGPGRWSNGLSNKISFKKEIAKETDNIIL